MRRADIVAAAATYEGTPWLHQGRSRLGLDCVGLLVAVARDLGVPISYCPTHGRLPQGEALLHEIDRYTMPSVGDLGSIMVLWVSPRTRSPQHVAIDAGDGWMIHAAGNRSIMRVVRQRIDDRWRMRLVCRRDFPGVTD
jgi:cell wall-associated NlpC family hydrolase